MSPRTRRWILKAGVAAVSVMAGCSENGGTAQTESPPTENSLTTVATETRTPESTATPSPSFGTPQISCEGASRPEPPVQDDAEVEPAEYPEKTGAIEDKEWIVEYERAYILNHNLYRYGIVDWHGVNIGETQSKSHADGLLVWMYHSYGLETEEEIIDSPSITVAYFVNGKGILRTQDETVGLDQSVDPIKEGEVIECF